MIRHCLLAAAAAATATTMGSPSAHAGADPWIGELALVGFTYCPRGWTEANGQLLAIAQYTALFALYGTTYGGDGRTTFALPDLRGRSPIGFGQGPGLPSYTLGEKGGSVSLSIGVANMPSHNHQVNATVQLADKVGPGSDLLARTDNVPIYHDGPADRTMDAEMITNTGGGQPIQKQSPYLAMRWCVALEGIFPPRN